MIEIEVEMDNDVLAAENAGAAVSGPSQLQLTLTELSFVMKDNASARKAGVAMGLGTTSVHRVCGTQAAQMLVVDCAGGHTAVLAGNGGGRWQRLEAHANRM